jgi:hypothetical protein
VDQHVIGSCGGAGADAKQGIERGMACPAPIEAEHEFIQLVLEVGLAQPMAAQCRSGAGELLATALFGAGYLRRKERPVLAR